MHKNRGWQIPYIALVSLWYQAKKMLLQNWWNMSYIYIYIYTLLVRLMEPIYQETVQKQINSKYCEVFSLKIGDYVCLHNGKTRSRSGKVIKWYDQPMSYLYFKREWLKTLHQQTTFVCCPTITGAQNFPLSRTSRSLTEIP